MSDKITVPRIEVSIRRDAHTISSTEVTPYELHVLYSLHGKENVTQNKAAKLTPAEVAPDEEYSRMLGKYGAEAVTRIFGDDEGLRLSEMVRAAELKTKQSAQKEAPAA